MSMDWRQARRMKPVRHPRSIVSVAFSMEEFQRVDLAAELVGAKLSTFIRETVLKACPLAVTETTSSTLILTNTVAEVPR